MTAMSIKTATIAYISLDPVDLHVVEQTLQQGIMPFILTAEADNADIIITSQTLKNYPRVGALLDYCEATLNQSSGILQSRESGPYKLSGRDKTLLINGGAPIQLTDREADIMATLMDAQREGCTRTYLLHNVWGYHPDIETHTLETHIYRMRQKIETDPENPQFLVTTNNGYRLSGL